MPLSGLMNEYLHPQQVSDKAGPLTDWIFIRQQERNEHSGSENTVKTLPGR